MDDGYTPSKHRSIIRADHPIGSKRGSICDHSDCNEEKDIKKKNRKRAALLFSGAFVIILACLIVSIISANTYNSIRYNKTVTGSEMFNVGDAYDEEKGVFVTAAARSSTWTKVFDFNNEGLTEHNYQAYLRLYDP